ncbi:hypothetical protein Tco_0126224, partial [Tanacetum coccineum]
VTTTTAPEALQE